MKVLSNSEIAEWASKAGVDGAFLFDKYCQKFRDAGLLIAIETSVEYGMYTSHPQASLRINVRGERSFRYIKTIYAGEAYDIVQLICTMEEIFEEYNSYKNHKRK